MGDEMLVVIPVERLRSVSAAIGFNPEVAPILAELFQAGATDTMPRSAAELDPRYKQLVAYVALRWQGKFFHYLRTSRVGEQRLAGRRSIGVGGHLNAADVAVGEGVAGLRQAIRRELAEEVDLEVEPTVRYAGIIDDDETPVSRVHLGIVAIADLGTPKVTLRDPSLTDGSFDDPRRLHARLGEFEGWSQQCLRALLTVC